MQFPRLGKKYPLHGDKILTRNHKIPFTTLLEMTWKDGVRIHAGTTDFGLYVS